MADGDADRADHDRGLRNVLLAVEELRGDLFHLAAHVIALQDELTRRLGADEAATASAAIEARIPVLARQIQAADIGAVGRLHLGDPIDKYEVPPIPDGGPPCLELLSICEARCCGLDVPLTSQDLDEGVIRWDRGNPYLIAQEADGYCTHLSRSGAGCTCYEHRPAPCREYDCREDRRIWIDYEQRLVVPRDERPRDRPYSAERRGHAATARQMSLMVESRSLRRPG